MIFQAAISNGKLTLSNRKRFEHEVSTLKDGAYEVSIRRKNRRSNPQNNYYWGIIIPEIRLRLTELGHRVEDEQVHELLKAKFLSVPISNDQGEVEHLPGSTAGLNKAEFSEYMDRTREWAAEFLGIEIPDPESNLTFFS
jgi:hypothetical protein